MDVGERIKQRRKELNINADDLANAADVSRATIFRYENGEIEKMPAVTLEKIAKRLRTSPAHLMGWTDAEDDFTMAAHIDDDVTEKEMDEIRKYIDFIKSKRN